MNQVVPRDDFDRAYLERLDTYRRELVDGLPPIGLAALALVPIWSERLLVRVGVALGNWTLDRFLDEAERRHLCVRGPVQSEDAWRIRQVRALMLLWPHMTPRLREMWNRPLLAAVDAMPPSLERLQFLVTLAAAIPDSVNNALANLDAWRDRESRARLLARLVANTKSTALAERAWVELDALPDAEERLSLRIQLLPCLPRGMDYALRAEQEAMDLDDLEARARACARLAAFFDDPDLARACRHFAYASARTISDAEERCLALGSIAPAFPADERAAVNDECLFSALSIVSPITRAHALARMTDAASSVFLQVQVAAHSTLLQLRGTPGQTAERDRAVASLAIPLATSADVAADLANDVRDPATRLDVYAAMVRAGSMNLTPEVSQSMLTSVTATGRWDLLPTFLAGFDGGMLRERVDGLVDVIPDRQTWQTVMVGIAAPLNGRLRDYYLTLVLRSINTLSDEAARLHGLAHIAPHLPEHVLEQACEFVWALRGDREFAMPDAQRPDVLLRLREVLPPSGDRSLQNILCGLGTALVGIGESGDIGMAPATARWAQIASRCVRPRVASEFLASTFDRLVTAGDTGEATEWYTTADRVVPIVGVELEPAVALGRRRVEVACRRLNDARHLRRYLHREDLEQAFERLIDGDADHWALHFIGMGGVGKTMLLRHVMANLAVKDGRPLPVARVDFDHMKPEYPVRQPAVLLVQLADELRLFLPAGAEDRYDKFQDRVLELHGALSREPEPGNPLQNIHSEEFDRLLKEFEALLEELPKPVIFILDTCEELAKLEPEGTEIPAVVATFEILDRIHERTKDIRVVFAGRRLLTRKGADWHAREETLSHRNAILPESKPFLLLHMILGFTEADADRYVAEIARVQLDADRRAAILKRSLDQSIPADIVRHGDTAETPAVPRYNPFDISLYADWVLADPHVSAETLGSGETDPYVEMRLLRRIDNEDVRRAVPAAILLRQFDEAMLEPVLPKDKERAARVYRDLGGQEWIDYRDKFLRVQTNLLPRLQEYFEKDAERELIATTTEQLATGLNTLVRAALKPTSPFDALSPPLLDAALRLLPAAEAVSLWDAVDRRLTDTGNWSTAERICEILLEQDHAAGKRAPLVAAVRATLTAARIHTWPKYDAANAARDWKQVAQAAPFHPNGVIRSWLTIRARLGQGESSNDLIAAIRAAYLMEDQWRVAQLRAAFLAAMEASIEQTGELPTGLNRAPVMSLGDDELEYYWRALLGSPTWDLPDFARPTRQRWAHWRAPVSITDRVRLMTLDQQSFAPDVLLARLRETIPRIDNIDAEVLASRLIQELLKHQLVPRDLLDEIEKCRLYDPDRSPSAAVHRKTPPLFAMVGEAFIANGDGGRAWILADNVRDEAMARQDTRAAEAAGVLAWREIRNFRQPKSMAALRGLVRYQHAGSNEAHYDWAVRYAGSSTETHSVLADFDARVSDVRHSTRPDDAHAALDFVEANLLGRRVGRQKVPPPFEVPTPDASASPSLVCRWFALHEQNVPHDGFEGPRQRAEALMEEAELLVLRLPSIAQKLCLDAHAACQDASDPCGAFRAAVCGAIAAFKAGDDNSAPVFLQYALRRYEDLRDARVSGPFGRDNLPPWSDMISSGLTNLRSNNWYPWLLRAQLINARLAEGAAGGPRTAAVRAEIAEFSTDETHPDFSLTSFDDAPTVRSWLRGVLTTMGETALGLAILGGLGYGLWQLIQWARRSDAGEAVLIVLVACILSPLAIHWAFLWLTRSAAVSNRLRLVVVTSPGRAELTLTAWLQLPLPFFGPREARTVMEPANGWFQPYLAAAPTAQDAVVRGLRSLRLGLLFRRLVVPLYVTIDADKYCWEGVLTPALERQGQRMREAVAFVRAARSLPGEPSGWTRWADASMSSARAWSENPERPLRVLHLLGRVRRGASGVVFTLSGETQPVRISELPLSRAAIVVVQEESVGRIQRRDVDREQTADTRQWAADVFAAGAHTMVLVPALPFEIAKEGIDAMTEKWGASKAPTLWRLVDGVSALRRRIYQDEASGSNEALNELACEVTLFARHTSFRADRAPTP